MNNIAPFKNSRGNQEARLTENDILLVDAYIQDQFTEEVNIYFHIDKLTTALTNDTAIDDIDITVDSVVGVIAGYIIVIYEGERKFQSIVKSILGNVITMVSPLDFAFTAGAIIHFGIFNLAVNGSVTPQIAHFMTPPDVKYDIYTINFFITDDAAMDSAKFGGIPALTNGILLKHKNGKIKNLMLVYNNHGFSEQGCTIEYDPKAPAGVYGFEAKKNYKVVSGVSLRLVGSTDDDLEIIIQDDLTDLKSFTATVQGHVVED